MAIKTGIHMNRQSYGPSRRISIAYYGNKGVIFKGLFNSSGYYCVGKQHIEYGYDLREVWNNWAKVVHVGDYSLYQEQDA